MASNEQVRFSKALARFQGDLEAYQKATGKATNEVLAAKALDFSIRYAKLLKAEAPSASEITGEHLGYNIRVRKKIQKQVGTISAFSDVASKKTFGPYSGAINRKAGGQTFTNKRALAVQKELAARRSSIGWLARSITKWKSSLNKDIPEGSVELGKAYTRRRTSQVGAAKGTFTETTDRVRVTGSAFALGEVDQSKGGLADKALKASSADMKQFLGKRIGLELKKNIKKSYR